MSTKIDYILKYINKYTTSNYWVNCKLINYKVSEIFNTEFNKTFVVKMYKKKEVLQYNNEAQILTYLKSYNFIPKIVGNYNIKEEDIIKDEKYNEYIYFIIVEKINGVILRDYKFKDYNEVIDIYKKIFNIYEILHHSNIAHIDGHSCNIIINNTDVYLIDFELSFKFDRNIKYNLSDITHEAFHISYNYNIYSKYDIITYFLNIDISRIVCSLMYSISDSNSLIKIMASLIFTKLNINKLSNDVIFAIFNYMFMYYNDFPEDTRTILKKQYDIFFSDNFFYISSSILNNHYKSSDWITIEEIKKDKIITVYNCKTETYYCLKMYNELNIDKCNNEITIYKAIKEHIIFIPRIKNFFVNKDEEKYFIIMEKLDGIPLINISFYTIDEIVNVYKKIYIKYDQLHCYNIIHNTNINKNISDLILIDNKFSIIDSKISLINFKYSVNLNIEQKEETIKYIYDKQKYQFNQYLKILEMGNIFISLIYHCNKNNFTLEEYLEIKRNLNLIYSDNELLFYYQHLIDNIELFDIAKFKIIEILLNKYKLLDLILTSLV
jgi:tRNA A-37 threonylcarbamoyl transferase component Bud32